MILAAATAETFTGLMDHVAQGFEALGAAILVVGVIWSFVLAAIAVRRSGWSRKAYLVLRQAFGGTLLLGLEVLVVADLVRTVAVSPTLDNVLVLGLIVVIRTFLSFSLETEIEGVAPWRRALISGAGTIRRASATAMKSKTPPWHRPGGHCDGRQAAMVSTGSDPGPAREAHRCVCSFDGVESAKADQLQGEILEPVDQPLAGAAPRLSRTRCASFATSIRDHRCASVRGSIRISWLAGAPVPPQFPDRSPE
jgi:uncharacterized membrane protein